MDIKSNARKCTTTFQHSITSCCAIIVTFYPSKDIAENVAALHDQVDTIIIVDNASGDSYQELWQQLTKQFNVSIIYNSENIGIAAALNLGLKKAKADGYQWIVTFDQDSQATPNMIDTMLQAYEIYPQNEKVVSLSPRYKDKNTGVIRGNQVLSSLTEIHPYLEAQTVMTSGNLLKLSVLDSVGYFNEALFIDCVDYEYCLRCINQGYKILEIKDAVLLHNVGFPVQHKLLWRTLTANNHSALRRYYYARNAVYIYKKFAFKQPIWVIKNCCVLMKMIVVVTFFEVNRKKKLKAIFRGFVDGLFDRMGKCSASI